MRERYDEQNAAFYGDDDDEAEEKFDGFEIVNENGVPGDDLKKLVEEIDDEQPIAEPVPDNEQKVLLFNTSASLPESGEPLELKLGDNGGALHYNGEKIGELKIAFVDKLRTERAGQYVAAQMFSLTPVMAVLYFSKRQKKNSVKIEPAQSGGN